MEDLAETVKLIVCANIGKPLVQLIDHYGSIVLGKRLTPIPCFLFQVTLQVLQHGNHKMDGWFFVR